MSPRSPSEARLRLRQLLKDEAARRDAPASRITVEVDGAAVELDIPLRSTWQSFVYQVSSGVRLLDELGTQRAAFDVETGPLRDVVTDAGRLVVRFEPSLGGAHIISFRASDRPGSLAARASAPDRPPESVEFVWAPDGRPRLDRRGELRFTALVHLDLVGEQLRVCLPVVGEQQVVVEARGLVRGRFGWPHDALPPRFERKVVIWDDCAAEI